MREIFSSIFKSSEERLKNPFIGAFLLSFLAINWKPILVVLISNKTIENRIDYVVENFSNISYTLFLPLAIAVFYIGVLPYLMMIFDKLTYYALSQRNDNLYKGKLLDIKGKKLVATSEIELENLKSDYKEKSDLNKKIKKLEDEISLRETRLDNFDKETSNLEKKILNLEKTIKEKDQSIEEYRERLEDNEYRFKNYYGDYKNTPESIVNEFVNSLHMINKYLTDSDKLNRESKNLIERFLSLGLIEYSANSKNNKRQFVISEKGLYFIKKAYEDNII